ncbi:MAG: hypothetical protein DRZ90_15825 [Spirochaetes bacterium]|nr:MAG: hypothetical protein DRZ90_15825 [Spirochaetota bacterium]
MKLFSIIAIAAACSAFLACSIPTDVNICQVSYNGNGRSGGTVPTDPVEYTSSQIISILDNSGHLECPEYSFGGWNTSSDGSGTSYQPGDTLETALDDITLFAVWLPASLIISEVGDPLQSEGRFIELYNSTSASVNLSTYVLRLYINGSTEPSSSFTLPDINLPSGVTFVIARDSTFSGVYPEPEYKIPDIFSTITESNGDDAYELYDGSKTVDLYGVKGEDGTGKVWEFTDRVVQRNLSVILGTDQLDISEWIKGPEDSDLPASPGSRFSN